MMVIFDPENPARDVCIRRNAINTSTRIETPYIPLDRSFDSGAGIYCVSSDAAVACRIFETDDVHLRSRKSGTRRLHQKKRNKYQHQNRNSDQEECTELAGTIGKHTKGSAAVLRVNDIEESGNDIVRIPDRDVSFNQNLRQAIEEEDERSDQQGPESWAHACLRPAESLR